MNRLILSYITFFMLNPIEHEILPLINVKMPTIVGILTCMSGKENILGLNGPKKAEFLDIFILKYENFKLHAQMS